MINQRDRATRLVMKRIRKSLELKSEVVDLSGLNIESLPIEIKSLTHVKELIVNRNKLKTLPDEIGDLYNLNKLRLTNNLISELPQVIKKLQKCTHIYLDKNKFENFPVILGELNDLVELRLNNNKIHSVPDGFYGFNSLECLFLNQNKISYVSSGIRHLANLRCLYLRDNLISSLPPEIRDLKSLVSFHVSGNPIDGAEIFTGRAGIQWVLKAITEPSTTILHMPPILRTAFKQYLLFFDDYLESTKGIRVGLEIRTIEEGLKLEVIEMSVSSEVLNAYFYEYMSFIKGNIENLRDKVQFEHDVYQNEKDILVIKLESQVNHLKTQLKIVQVENMRLEEFLHKALSRPLNFHTTALADASSHINMKLDSGHYEEFSKLQKALDELREKVENTSLKEVQDLLDKVHPNTSKEKVCESGILPKISRIIKKGLNSETELGKIVKSSESGLENLKKIIRAFNELAKWTGFPSIPNALFNSDR